MTVRLRKTSEKKIQVVENRRDHFRKTLLIASALGVVAVCVYFFSQMHAAQESAQNTVSVPSQQAASSQY